LGKGSSPQDQTKPYPKKASLGRRLGVDPGVTSQKRAMKEKNSLTEEEKRRISCLPRKEKGKRYGVKRKKTSEPADRRSFKKGTGKCKGKKEKRPKKKERAPHFSLKMGKAIGAS